MSAGRQETALGKRSHDVLEESTSPGRRDEMADSSSDEDDMGPQLPSAAAPKKKRRKLPYEKLYIAALPRSSRYSKSLMHKDQVAFVLVTPVTDFVVTGSVDGYIKFWKKMAVGIEFVKEFRAHSGNIRSVSVSCDGRSLASAGEDRSIKIFDVASFDLLTMLTLEFTPRCLCWVHSRGASLPLLAISDEVTHNIHLFDGRGESPTPIHSIKNLHRSIVSVIAYNSVHDCVVSADESGAVEYWRPHGTFEAPDDVFKFKSATDLFEFKKAKSVPACISFAPDGTYFATLSFPDRKVRIFNFRSGKLYRSYDESLQAIEDMQQAGTALQKLDDADFARRMADERELDAPSVRRQINIIFDESNQFILYGSMLGIKVVNLFTNRVVRVFGKDESFRAINLALYQGQPQKKTITTVAMAASENPLLQASEARDPILFSTGAAKVRFYMFNNDENISKSERDVQNEKPTNQNLKKVAQARTAESGTAAVIHTTLGDIHIRLFPDAAPKAVENFVTHSRRGYYNNTIFHRVIRKFMIQCGDPLGDGTGGESIWGKEFGDEFSSLKHDKPYTVSMANAGPNTNGSQFFITTEKASWLDNKHTIFGRAVQGLDVVHKIENTRVYKEKPEEDIKILNIDVV